MSGTLRIGSKVGHSIPFTRFPDCLPQADLRTSSPLVSEVPTTAVSWCNNGGNQLGESITSSARARSERRHRKAEDLGGHATAVLPSRCNEVPPPHAGHGDFLRPNTQPAAHGAGRGSVRLERIPRVAQ